jgi:ATP-dependent Lhr-like helicase
LPRRFPGRRSPLWAQRRRAADLLTVAARHGSFPILLETYRECLKEVFDLESLKDLFARIRQRTLRIVTVDSPRPSPFAASLLFSYAANFLYEGDAPLAERRAQALSLDIEQLRELLGEGRLRELLDVGAIEQTDRALRLLERPLREPEELCDALRQLGHLSSDDLAMRCDPTAEAEPWLQQLQAQERIVSLELDGGRCFIVAEEARVYHDALGVALPGDAVDGTPRPKADALDELLARYARTHTPFTANAAAQRFAVD